MSRNSQPDTPSGLAKFLIGVLLNIFNGLCTPRTFSTYTTSTGKRNPVVELMGRYREKTSAFFTRLTYGLGRKRPPATIPPWKPIGPPAPQTSLSTSLCICSLDQALISFIPFSQFSSSQTNLSLTFSLTSPQTHNSLAAMLSSAFHIVWGLLIATIRGSSFYDCLYHWMVEGDIFMKKLDAITNALYANVSPAASVK